MTNRLVLIDLSSIAYPLWHLSGSEPDPNWTSTQIVAKIRALASAHPHVGICCDSGKSFRVELSADYKATRPERDATLQHQISVAVDTLRGDGFPVWSAQGYEADDLIATAVSAAQPPDSDGAEVLIISADKDLLQLVSDQVKVFRPAVGTAAERTYDAAAVLDKFSVAPNQFVDLLALVGDKSDNIAGAKGVGPVTAAKLLATFGTVEDLQAAMQKREASLTPALDKSLTDFFSGSPSPCDLARSLIRLRTDAPIPFAEIFQTRVPVDAAAFGADDDIAFAMETLIPEAPHDDVGRTKGARDPGADGATDGGRRGETPSAAGGGAADPGVQPVETPTIAADHPAALSRRSAPGATAVGEWERQLEPQDIIQAKELANWIFQSRLFSAYGHPAGVLTTILAGREMGLPAMASLRAMHIVEGKPTLAADFIRALVVRSGLVEYFRCSERTPDRATFIIKRKDEPEMSLTYTLDEARAAGLVKPKSGWERNAADMLVARASSKLARLVCPEITFGLYAREEFE